MRDARCRVTVLDQDATDVGIPSVVVFPPESVRLLLDHLVSLGHRRIDCLNTQGEDDVIRARSSVWERYLKEHGLLGQYRSLAIGRPIKRDTAWCRM